MASFKDTISRVKTSVDLDKEKIESGYEDININLGQTEILYVRNHAELDNLDYDHAGHTGFASSEYVNTNFAASLEIEQEISTGIVTVSLLSLEGVILDTKTLDLSTEKIITAVELDYTNKKLIFHLLDGTTIECDISAMIDGLHQEITAEKERALAAEQALSNRIDALLPVLSNTTAYWTTGEGKTIVPLRGQIVIYEDHETITTQSESGATVTKNVPGFKVGDGTVPVPDLPFADAKTRELLGTYTDTMNNHISNTTVHITAEERTKWNGKLNCSDTITDETLVLTRD